MSRLNRFAVLALSAVMMGFCFCLGYSASNPDPATCQAGSALPTTPLSAAAVESPPTGTTPRMATDYGQLPLYFIENRGQVDRRVHYYVRGGGQTTFFAKDEVVLTLARPGKNPASFPFTKEVDGKFEALNGMQSAADPNAKAGPPTTRDSHRKSKTEKQKLSVVRLQPVGLKKGAKLAGLHQTGHRVNYFIGNDPKKWRTDIPTYQAVVYENAYAGIDLKFYGQGRQLEYDIVVKPGADPNQVKFAYQGVQKIVVTPAGDLALVLPDGGRLLQKKPVVYQEIAGRRLPVEGKYRLARRGAQVTCGFALAAYDKTQPLVIDPVVIVYSTYLGGGADDAGLAIAVDKAGQTIVTGWTQSVDFPVQYQLSFSQGMKDIFVTKFAKDGGSLIFSTYLGGTNDDEGRSIALDANGQIHLAGRTFSDNFPTTSGAYQSAKGGSFDAVVTKLDAAGGALLFSTYLGGTIEDTARGIAVDAAGNVYVTGFTKSTDFPKQAPLYATLGGSQDAFVSKFSPGGALIFSTYLGGANSDEAASITVSPAGQIYVTGNTYSATFPTVNALYNTIGVTPDAFVTSIRADLSGLAFSTFLGGNASDYGNSVALDSTGKVYVGGYTYSTNFPTRNPRFPTNAGKADAFLTKIKGDGSALVYSTYLGGSEADHCYAIAVDPADEVTLTGVTASANFYTLGAFSGVAFGLKGPQDAFVARFRADGRDLVFSSYLGGGGSDTGIGIAVDKMHQVYVTGQTNSVDFPVKNALYPNRSGSITNYDAFVMKMRLPVDNVACLFLLLFEN